jgi:hypothetical protein
MSYDDLLYAAYGYSTPDTIIESDDSVKMLYRKALASNDEQDWATYENALVRAGKVKKQLLSRVSRTSILDTTKLLKLLADLGEHRSLRFRSPPGLDDRGAYQTWRVENVNKSIMLRKLLGWSGHGDGHWSRLMPMPRYLETLERWQKDGLLYVVEFIPGRMGTHLVTPEE